jgi:hypothetical protein
MNKVKEINQGYLDNLRGVSHHSGAADEVAYERPVSLPWRIVSAVGNSMDSGLKQRLRPVWIATLRRVRIIPARVLPAVWKPIHQVVGTTLLVLTSLVLATWLKVYLWVKGSPATPLTDRAIKRIPEFLEQYPFHLYPVVLKSLEFAFLEDELSRLLSRRTRFLEIAIGEGTFSGKIFPPDADVVGLDLNPYSLWKAVQLPHVKRAVICDCLRPPISGGHFDVVIANNFLHHVTMKEQTLANWSRVAPELIFNESTPYWAACWAAPFILQKMGFKRAAQRKIDEILLNEMQHLDSKEALGKLVLKDYELIESSSYFNARTFFLCATYSFIMRCYGPPTPAHLKKIFLSKSLRWFALPLTTTIAELLIRYDQYQDRSKDVYVSYVCKSKYPFTSAPENYLTCPRCSAELNENDRCTACGKQYESRDQMLFLLPEEIEYVETGYDPNLARLTPAEHL